MKVYLADTENIGHKWESYADLLDRDDKLLLFYTSHSKPKKIKENAQVQEIYCECGTSNALDFQLCTCLGMRVKANKKAQYIILSNDHGYDAAVHFLQKQGFQVKRSPTGQDTAMQAKKVKLKQQKTQQPKDAINFKTSISNENLIGSLFCLKKSSKKRRQIVHILECSRTKAELKLLLTTQFGQHEGQKMYDKLCNHLAKIQTSESKKENKL